MPTGKRSWEESIAEETLWQAVCVKWSADLHMQLAQDRCDLNSKSESISFTAGIGCASTDELIYIIKTKTG